MNNDIQVETVRADSNLLFKSSTNKPKRFKGKKLNKYLPTSVFFSKKASAVIIDKKNDRDSINKSLQSMSLSTLPAKKEESLTYIVYVPTTHNSEVLIASLPRSIIFMNEGYKHSSMRDIKYYIAKTLLDTPSNSIDLEQQARGGVNVYSFRCPSSSNSFEQPIKSIVENTAPINNIDLKIWESSIIYIKKYFTNLARNIYDMTYKCGGAMCIESNANLLSQHELYELKKNDDMKAILETKSVNKKYNFSICVNSVITDLTKSVYLNFFNIPGEDLEYIRKNPDINSLELKQCNAK
jgi:hypothetical protein